MNINDVATIVSAISALLSAVAAYIGIHISRKAIDISNKAIDISNKSIDISDKIHKSQTLLAQRQLLLPLWEYMSSLSEINPKSPITPDIIKLVNTLELVALCCEGGLIDEQVILRTFREQFMNHFMSIKKCADIPGLNINGEELLMENKAAWDFYNKLQKDRMSKDRISSQP